MIKKIWNDPVWSKVISVGIIGLISFVYLTIKSKVDGISLQESLQNLIELKVRLLYVVVVVLIYIIGKSVLARKKGFFTRKQERLRRYDRNEDIQRRILYRWTVWFDDDRPFISDLEVFCTRHDGAPIRFVNGHCPVNDCDNNHINMDYHLTKNHIESILIDQWDKIK